MAKYTDYVKQPNVDQELQEVQSRKRNIPESVSKRFDGKSLDDVLESYAELQALSSRQGEDVGNLRKTVSQLLELQSQVVQPSSQVTAEPDTGITTDDLYADPNQAVRKVVKAESKQTADRVAQLEQRLAVRETELNIESLNSRYKGWRDEIATAEFKNWAQSSKARSRLAQQADQYDFDAANDLLELWYDRKGSGQQVQDSVERERQFRDATLESSSPATSEHVETFSRADLQEKRIAAKLGNRQAERWLQANSAAITAAYREGRITN